MSAPREAAQCSGNRTAMDLFDCWRRKARLSGTSAETSEITVQILRSSPQSTVIVSGRVTVDSSPRVRSVLLELLGD